LLKEKCKEEYIVMGNFKRYMKREIYIGREVPIQQNMTGRTGQAVPYQAVLQFNPTGYGEGTYDFPNIE
jgi:hypothetical protein